MALSNLTLPDQIPESSTDPRPVIDDKNICSAGVTNPSRNGCAMDNLESQMNKSRRGRHIVQVLIPFDLNNLN